MHKRERNSSIELLRLLAMLMIVGFHYLIMNESSYWVSQQPMSMNKFVLQTIIAGGGVDRQLYFLFHLSLVFIAEGA